ncbi:YadA-like family protein [Stenotrophomonas sepilia]
MARENDDVVSVGGKPTQGAVFRILIALSASTILAGVAPSSMAATGNGFVTVCNSDGSGGQSYGPAGATSAIDCPTAFRLGNDGGLNGIGGADNTVMISGAVDGNLYIRGLAGVHVTGPTTFRNAVSLNGNKISGLAVGAVSEASTDAINGAQLWRVDASWEARWNALDSRISSIIKPVDDPGSVAIGRDSVVTQEGGTAIGDGTSVTGRNSVAVGAGSSASRDNEFSVGAEGNERVVSNVARGTRSTDAVNLGQMEDRFAAEREWNTDRFAAEREWANNRFRSVDRRIDRMGAISAAYAGMAINTAGLSGDNRLGAGVGSQNGRTALAVGYQRIIGERKNASLSLGGAFSGSDRSISAGAGVSW